MSDTRAIQTKLPDTKDAEVVKHFSSQSPEKAKVRIARKFEDFLGGDLRSVEIDDEGRTRRAYCLSLKRSDLWFDSVEELLQWSTAQKASARFRDLDFGQFITGIIAIIIISLIGFWALVIRGDPPGYLGTALTTILGFYFGRASSTRD